MSLMHFRVRYPTKAGLAVFGHAHMKADLLFILLEGIKAKLIKPRLLPRGSPSASLSAGGKHEVIGIDPWQVLSGQVPTIACCIPPSRDLQMAVRASLAPAKRGVLSRIS